MTPSLGDSLREHNIDAREFAWGDVYLISDQTVSFPATPAGKRVVRKTRPVVVLHNEELNHKPTYPVVLVAPISSIKDLKGHGSLDVDVPSGEAGLGLPSIVHVGLLQPVLKTSLTQKLGQFSEDYCELLEGFLAKAVFRTPPEEEEEVCEADYDPFAEE